MNKLFAAALFMTVVVFPFECGCASSDFVDSLGVTWVKKGDFTEIVEDYGNQTRTASLIPASKIDIVDVFLGEYKCGAKRIRVVLNEQNEELSSALTDAGLKGDYTYNNHYWSKDGTDLSAFLTVFVDKGFMAEDLAHHISEIILGKDESL